MNNRYQIAKEFAEKIKSEKINTIILFGSVARGEDKKCSDIDILIVSPEIEDIEDKIFSEIVEILIDKEEHISASLMTIKEFNKEINYPFLTNVLNEGIYL